MNAAVASPRTNEPSAELSSTSLRRYETHLEASIAWLERSVMPDSGSRAFVYAWGRWTGAYPETTGYIIPTLLDYARLEPTNQRRNLALKLGDWLLDIQADEGYWHGGTHPVDKANPSVFNSAQILIGLCALYRETKEERWLASAVRGAQWLVAGLNPQGEWSQGNYQSSFNPSYYTRVAWPMLEVWSLSKDDSIREGAERVLRNIQSRRLDNGSFSGWGFKPEMAAYTHTIAYTLRGFMESARLLEDWPTWGKPTEQALNKLVRKAELAGGNLPGAFYEDWRGVKSYTCLTGNAQLALCFLKLHQRDPDLRLVNAAAKLVDRVCQAQQLQHPVEALRGAVAGSSPVWGRYMVMRYPNWAAKFHADALMLLSATLRNEGLS